MLIELLNVLLLGKLLETKEKHDVVREHDDLPCLRLLDQSSRNTLSPPVVERGNGIVEDDCGMIVGRA